MGLIIWVIILPLLIAFSLGLVKFYFKKYINIILMLGSTLHLLLVFKVVAKAIKEPLIYNLGGWNSSLGISLVVDSFSALFVLLIGILSYIVIIYSISYIQKSSIKYYILILLLLTGAMGMVLTGDLFNLYVFFEIVSITSYALTALSREDKNIEASFKYLILGSISGIFILLATILVYSSTGTLNLAQVAIKFKSVSNMIQVTIIVFYLFGFATKFALIPLHSWLVDAYSNALVTFSTLSSGVVIKTSLYALMRIMYLFYGVEFIKANLTTLLIYWGAVTFLVAHLLANQQDTLRRLLGYSSIAHMGYIIMAFAVGNNKGIIAGNYHLLNHIVMKGTLFLATGIFIYNIKSDRLEDIKGIAWNLPYISMSFTIAALAIIGLPPFNGFISKWLIVQAVLEADYVIPAFLILVGSLWSLIYYLKVIVKIYSQSNNRSNLTLIPWNLKVPTLILSLSCLLLGIFPNFFFQFIIETSEALINRSFYINLF
ncbi:proton-conducting transporter membrane subunit [Halanaerocella petrolearia]